MPISPQELQEKLIQECIDGACHTIDKKLQTQYGHGSNGVRKEFKISVPLYGCTLQREIYFEKIAELYRAIGWKVTIDFNSESKSKSAFFILSHP